MSLTPTDIQKLASLSRMKLSEEEQGQFTKEIDSILGYVEQIKEVSASAFVSDATAKEPKGVSEITHAHKNVLREDADDRNLNARGEPLVSAAPESQVGLIKVKKILN